ncbi:5-formyltetrahydrofolate cyclo-ligase [Pandoraea nosoerga]|uniref:5-formyltetrahydrofolate cyclo-ligase n=1 Tax=Pandoraea nosoerga TaxID=2508296 RepID=UPI001582427C|nr:5-formyltetrahydrofolate cyclo-ligase [Pandoraea nosoerga]MBN4667252.1 5-formyltetrahydrofolate cyclo-ligase [Pandoraea nosoerga]MBN4676619.1 5-formyltetrahydrofolate cyclo-ligase [Pandoraea nosoerga]MBN4682181.1 5-formyltetrahydrofolate cyclo-ligase [Pandoraea nosoerga]MBN4743450.1 5-formyltetrahydrofolate cyclo-ligase [Pandoraea nosoerga]
MSSSIARDPARSAAQTSGKAQLRRALLAVRNHLDAREVRDAALAARLADELARRAPRCVGFYWPIQGEFDARGAVSAWLAKAPAGEPRLAALPVVAAPATPLVFHHWTPDTPMTQGRYRIPVPLDTEVLVPDLLLVPCVGFTRDGLRLGYGGGFYDRTLHSMTPPPQTLGIAYDALEIEHLDAEAHDLALDAIVTESATFARARGNDR